MIAQPPPGLAPLYDTRNWVNWDREVRPGETKPTKVPYRPSISGPRVKAKANDPATWDTFAVAQAAVESGRFHGLGYEFHIGEGLVMFDLDGVIVEGKIAPIARAAMALLNTYAEPSPSDTGIRIIARAELPRPHVREGVHGKKKGGFEMYGGAHFGTLTFRPFRGYDQLREVDAETMERVFALLWPDDVPGQVKEIVRPLAPPAPIDLDDADLLEKAFAAKGGDDFYRLHHGSNGRGSASEDDFAYIGRLRFWAQGDPTRMRRIALSSGRVREKWQSRRGAVDWLDYTIAKALSEPHEVYDPSRASGKRIAFTTDDTSEPRAAAAVAEREQVIARLEEENERLHERLAAVTRERERLVADIATLQTTVAAYEASSVHHDQTIGGSVFDLGEAATEAYQRGDTLVQDGREYARIVCKKAAKRRSAGTLGRALEKLQRLDPSSVVSRPEVIETDGYRGEVEIKYLYVPEEDRTPARAALRLLPPPAEKRHGGNRRKFDLPAFEEPTTGPIKIVTEKKRIYSAVAEGRVLKVEPLETHTEYCDTDGLQMTTAEVEAFQESIGLKIRVPAYRPQQDMAQAPLSETDAALFDREPVDLDAPLPPLRFPSPRCAWQGCGLPPTEGGMCERHHWLAGQQSEGAG
jgi:primase-polymerase (primpol)-like protein